MAATKATLHSGKNPSSGVRHLRRISGFSFRACSPARQAAARTARPDFHFLRL